MVDETARGSQAASSESSAATQEQHAQIPIGVQEAAMVAKTALRQRQQLRQALCTSLMSLPIEALPLVLSLAAYCDSQH